MTPSLDCDSPLDLKLKSNLIADLFSLIWIKKYDRKTISAFQCKNKNKKNIVDLFNIINNK